MAITAVGFDGAVDEKAFARLISEGGSPYGAPHSLATGMPDRGALKVIAKPGGTRQVQVTPGAVSGWGVRVTSDILYDVAQLPAAPTGQSKWYAIVIRRDWSGAGGVATIGYVPGGSTPVLPGALANTPGESDDQPIALVQLRDGVQAPVQIIPLHAFPSKVHMADSLLGVPAFEGALASVGGATYRREGAAWVRQGSPQTTYADFQTNTATNQNGDFTIVLQPGTISGDIVLCEFNHVKYTGFPDAISGFTFTWTRDITTLTALKGRMFKADGTPYANQKPTVGFRVTTTA